MIDLGQIVILGRQPEHGDAVHSGRRRLLRQFDRSQRFEDRKQRSPEETDLLPRNRRERSLFESVNVSQRLRKGTPSAILPLKNFANLAAPHAVVNDALRFILHPLRKNRGARIKAANGRSVGKVIKKETSSMRNLLEGQTLRLHRQL